MTEMEIMAKEYQKAFGITPAQWLDNSREAEKMHAQREFAKRARLQGHTWRAIAKACGKRDHSTMIKLCQQVGWREKNILAGKGK